jgi:hypothetical protein
MDIGREDSASPAESCWVAEIPRTECTNNGALLLLLLLPATLAKVMLAEAESQSKAQCLGAV